MNAQDLKSSILQRAIEGKLVPQRQEEGTAKELLAEIRAEKARLIKEKKIKKSKPLPEITDEEKPFDIPDSWEWVRLGELGEWCSGATPSRQHPEYFGGNIPWLKTGDLNDGYIKKVPESITNEGFQHSSTKINPIGSVLIAMYGATIGRLGILQIPATTNQACCACELFYGTYNKYLFYFLLANRKNFIKQGAGGAQPNISKAKIIDTTMPLPPMEEQHRIVAKIEELLPDIDAYDKAQTELRTIEQRFPNAMKKSLLQYAIEGKLVPQRKEEGTAKDLLTAIRAEKAQLIKEKKIKKTKPLPAITDDEKPYAIPDSWEWIKWGDIGEIVSARRVHQQDWKTKGIPFYRAREIAKLAENGVVDNDLFISEELYNAYAKNGVPEPEDLMITAVGTLGKTYIVQPGDKFYYKDASVISLRNYGHVSSAYLKIVMETPLMEKQIKSNSSGTTVSTLTIVRMNNYLLPLPPLAEQHRIVAKLEELLPLCQQLAANP
ncbi:restriction endonuclease subunit S [Mitsuokella jalaludinii]|uniref:restriction endonuclease subunit S n=1 Tax=Mitsuokella jalaludinii TaxID=187979 RepID=UPI00307AA59C